MIYYITIIVLDRVKNFLPIIEKANQELEEKIKLQGASSIIIDSNLEKIPIHDSNDDNKSLIQEVDETKSDNINEVVQNDIKVCLYLMLYIVI